MGECAIQELATNSSSIGAFGAWQVDLAALGKPIRRFMVGSPPRPNAIIVLATSFFTNAQKLRSCRSLVRRLASP